MANKPTLVILAAGIGSRYGGMKQIDGVGNHGEPIIEFSIYDAKEAGFGKVVFIIRPEHEQLFEKALVSRIRPHMEVAYAYQDIHDLPEGFTLPEGREKPFGTVAALLSLRGVVNEPFAIINADDFYGKGSYRIISDYLQNEISDYNYAMVGFKCRNTLTENGTVTRGVCESDENNYLTHIVEVQKIAIQDDKVVYEEDGKWLDLADETLVSMNMLGFTPSIFEQAEPKFKEFLQRELEKDPMKCEYVLPTLLGELLNEKKCTVKVLPTSERWFGVTYKEDKPSVVKHVQELKDDGTYPDELW